MRYILPTLAFLIAGVFSPAQAQTVCPKTDTACIVQHNDMAALTAAIKALGQTPITVTLPTGTTAPTTGGNGATGGTGTTPTVTAFPANPGDAPCPSPENSSIIRTGSDFAGPKYLRDKDCALHTLGPVTPGLSTGYFINGAETPLAQWDKDAKAFIAQVTVRSGLVYARVSSGRWTLANPGMNNSLYNASLPDAVTTQPGATPAAPVVSYPVPNATAPGSSNRTLAVGPSATYKTITAAIQAGQPGDTVSVAPGTYKEAPPAFTVPLAFVCAGANLSCVVDGTGLTASLARGKAIFVPAADVTFTGFKIVGAALDQEGANGTSGIRPDAGCGYLTLNNTEVSGNQNGILTGGDVKIVITLNNSQLINNGLPVGNSGRGYTHNFYGTQGTILVMNNSDSINPAGGHAIKNRGPSTTINGGNFSAQDAAIIDQPEGGIVVVKDAAFTKPVSDNHSIMSYGSDNVSRGTADVNFTGGSVNALAENPFVIGPANMKFIFTGTKFSGNKLTGITAGLTVN